MSSQDKFVCADCFEDSGIRDFIKRNSKDTRCSFCRESEDAVEVALLQDVVKHMVTCILYEWDDANEWLPYESREGGYQGYYVDTEELLRFELELEFPRDINNQLSDAIIGSLPEYIWCEINPYGVNDRNRAIISWEIFCDVVKHRSRYFFEDHDEEIEFDAYNPGQTLRKLFAAVQQYRLLQHVPVGKILFRARFQDSETAFTTPQELGPPPRDKAIQHNRMSPAGVSMFYASDQAETALRETVDEVGTYSVGRFVTRRNMVLLDLTQIPPIPSLFQVFSKTLEYRPREVLRFLNHIAAEISKPIERDDKVHINYVPTQVGTEFVRSRLRLGSQRIDGIKYGSAVHKRHASYVIFATQDNLVVPKETRWGPTSNQWLELVADPVTRWVSSETILKWKEETNRLRSTTLPFASVANVI